MKNRLFSLLASMMLLPFFGGAGGWGELLPFFGGAGAGLCWAGHIHPNSHIIYELNLYNFTAEGTLAAAEQRLDAIKDLGVDVVWLMPIHPRSKSDRIGKLGSPYAPADYTAVNPDFGTLDDLRHYVRAAHDRGMQVWLDWVPNHTGTDNVWTESHPEYYQQKGGAFVHPNNYGDVLQLNYGNTVPSSGTTAPSSVATVPLPSGKGRVKVKPLFEPGYNDKILLHEGQLDNWKAYLDDNPRRLLLKRQNPQLFTVLYGMEVAGHRCQIVGNRFLLDVPDKVAVIVHRRYTDIENTRLREEWLACGERGGVLVSAAISPKEKEVLREAMNRGYRIILLRENGFPNLYKPSGESFFACSEGLLLQISPWEYHMEKHTITRAQCLELNTMAERIVSNSHFFSL